KSPETQLESWRRYLSNLWALSGCSPLSPRPGRTMRSTPTRYSPYGCTAESQSGLSLGSPCGKISGPRAISRDANFYSYHQIAYRIPHKAVIVDVVLLSQGRAILISAVKIEHQVHADS